MIQGPWWRRVQLVREQRIVFEFNWTCIITIFPVTFSSRSRGQEKLPSCLRSYSSIRPSGQYFHWPFLQLRWQSKEAPLVALKVLRLRRRSRYRKPSLIHLGVLKLPTCSTILILCLSGTAICRETWKSYVNFYKTNVTR